VAYTPARGFTKGRLLIEPQAKTTIENALVSRQMLAPEREKWPIVTSAVHIPRAVGAFREVGVLVLPWPVFDQQTGTAEAGRKTLHEVFGLLENWILGRTSSPLPAPSLQSTALMAAR